MLGSPVFGNPHLQATQRDLTVTVTITTVIATMTIMTIMTITTTMTILTIMTITTIMTIMTIMTITTIMTIMSIITIIIIISHRVRSCRSIACSRAPRRRGEGHCLLCQGMKLFLATRRDMFRS